MGARRLYCGGVQGKILVRSGAAWSRQDLPVTTYDAWCLHGTAPDNLMVGVNPVGATQPGVFHWDGATYTFHPMSGGASGAIVTDVWVFSATEAAALLVDVAPNSSSFWTWDGVSWSLRFTYGTLAWWCAMQALSPTEIYITGPAFGWNFWMWDGVAMQQEPAGTYPYANTVGLAVIDSNTIYVATRTGPHGGTQGGYVYIGKLGGPWTIDLNYVVDGDGPYEALSNCMACDPATGVVVLTTWDGTDSFMRKREGGSWTKTDLGSVVALPKIDHPITPGYANDEIVIPGDSAAGDGWTRSGAGIWSKIPEATTDNHAAFALRDTSPVTIPQVIGNRATSSNLEYCIDVDDDKRNTLTQDGTGELIRDYTVQSRARFRLTCRRGEWWADKDLGSLLHTVNTLGQAHRLVLSFCQQALQPLIDADLILGVTVLEIEEDPVDGTLAAHIELEVPEGEAIDLGLIPVGA